MAVRFPEPAQPVEETRINYLFGRLIAVEQGQRPGELWEPTCVAIDPNTDHIYVVEGDCFNFTGVSIFSGTGKYLNSFTHGGMKYPWGIAIHRDNVYVTDFSQHTLFHFKLEADIRFVTRVGDGESGSRLFNFPKQLAVSNNGDVFVSDSHENRIQILDSSLQYQRQISHHTMTLPCDVKLTPNEVYVLSDADSHCVHVFSHAGEKIRSLITRGDGLQVTTAVFFCLDPDGNFIISDFGSNEIKIFSKEGTLLHKLGESGLEGGMFDGLLGVALSDTFKLVVVCENEDYGLQIFFN